MIKKILLLLQTIDQLIKKHLKKIKRTLVFLCISGFVVIFSPGQTFLAFGGYARTLLIITMYIRPLRDLFPKFTLLQTLGLLRRELGILTATFGLAHGIGYLLASHVNISYLVSDPNSYLFWGTLAVLVSIPLLITSNNFSVSLLGFKKRKYLQHLSYAMFILVAIHISLIHRDPSTILVLLPWIVLLVVAHIKNKKKKTKKTEITSFTNKRLCIPCGYIYDPKVGDPDGGIPAGTLFEDIPNNRVCPVCGVGKKDFIQLTASHTTESIAKVLEITYLNSSVIKLIIETEQDYSFLPGQFMTMKMEDGQGAFYRSYSIAQKTGRESTFLIKLHQGGRSAGYFSNLRIADTIQYSGIQGQFLLNSTPIPKIFLAAGTGLAPVLAMTESIPTLTKELHFSVPKQEDIFYEQELGKIPNLKTFIHLTREENPQYKSGRITPQEFTYGTETEFYLCGAPDFVTAMYEQLSKKGYTNIFLEKF